MNQVWEFFRKLFDTTDFPPRWHCGKWSEFHGWFYIISDLLIWSAYFAIPFIIIKYITRRRDARFVRLYFLFASFILACGATHFLDAITFWLPVYRLNALVRFATGIISWVTVFYLIKLLPEAFNLKTSQQLEAEVTQRELAETQLKINNEMLNEAQAIAKVGHWQWDVKQDKIYWSKSLRKIYGLSTKNELTYKTFLQYVHPDDISIVEQNINTAFKQKEFPDFYHRIVTDDGEVKTLHAKGQILLDTKGEVSQMIGTGQDVTEQKKVEQELLRKSQELENTNLELQKFASVASHDLREPMRKIITFSSMLEREYKDTISDSAKMYLDKITKASLQMQKLIDDILDFSNLTERVYHFEQVDLNELIKEVLSDLEISITQNEAEITVAKLPSIEGDPGQLNRLFQNIISNALKFRKNIKPVIHIDAEIIRGNQLPAEYKKHPQYNLSVLDNPEYWETELFCKIYIEDNGIGFDAAYVDRIFQIFQRLHSKSDYEGTGIGLAVCKKIVDLHNGIITATSKPGDGSIFIIILPVSQKNISVRVNRELNDFPVPPNEV